MTTAQRLDPCYDTANLVYDPDFEKALYHEEAVYHWLYAYPDETNTVALCGTEPQRHWSSYDPRTCDIFYPENVCADCCEQMAFLIRKRRR